MANGSPRRKRRGGGGPPIAAAVAGALAFVVAWTAALILTALALDREATGGSRTSSNHHPRLHDHEGQRIKIGHDVQYKPQLDGFGEDEVAEEIPGIELLIPSPTPGEDPIQAVYANITSSPLHARSKGVVLLLHACSHSALKFFSPSSSSCKECVGLSEELRIVRLVTQQGYIPIAVTSARRKRGCWAPLDVPRIKAVLRHELFAKYQDDGTYSVFGIGASSGGAFAAQLLNRGVIQGALIMVMQLGPELASRVLNASSKKPIYLAPMPRDERRMKKVAKSYQDLKSVMKEYIALDGTSCKSLPVTTGYLVQRVPGMTAGAADELVAKLKGAGHLDPSSSMLTMDPTKSDWRAVVSSGNSTRWWDAFDLTPGYSPLAKALNRAWAFHEYCSESVLPGLRFLERHKPSMSEST